VILADVNVLVYAHRAELAQHEQHRAWLSKLVNGDQTYAVSDFVINGFVRLVTNHRIFRTPSTIDQALTFADQVRNQHHAVLVSPGPRHWDTFTKLCHEAGAKGGLVPDAYLAALAIEHGCELATADRGFARFPGLRLHRVADAGQ
jgi:uncharacterized protein